MFALDPFTLDDYSYIAIELYLHWKGIRYEYMV